MTGENRRKSSRVTVNLLVGETTGGKYFLPLLANLSETGLYLECPGGLDRPRAHDRYVELPLPGVPDLVRARCKLIRTEDHGFFEGEALEFMEISAVDRNYVRMYIQRCVGVA